MSFILLEDGASKIILEGGGGFLLLEGSASLEDLDTIYVDLQPSSVELEEAVDSAIIPVLITPSGIEGIERTDADTVYIELDASGTDAVEPLTPWWEPLPTGTRTWFEITQQKWPIETQTRFKLTVRGRI